MSDVFFILITVVVSTLLLLVMHLVRIAFWKKMPDWMRHVLGILGLFVPLSILFVVWRSWLELVALWAVIVFGGGSLLLAFVGESWLEEHFGRLYSEQRESLSMKTIREMTDEILQEMAHGKVKRKG